MHVIEFHKSNLQKLTVCLARYNLSLFVESRPCREERSSLTPVDCSAAKFWDRHSNITSCPSAQTDMVSSGLYFARCEHGGAVHCFDISWDRLCSTDSERGILPRVGEDTRGACATIENISKGRRLICNRLPMGRTQRSLTPS